MSSQDVLIMCVGNRDGGDDAIGPYIADKLKKETPGFLVLDCGTIPENYTAVVKRHKPKMLVLIDAADMGLPAGEMRIIPKEKLGRMHISTHGIPLTLLISYLEQDIKQIVFIGIQPKTMSGPLSLEVQNSAKHLIHYLKTKNIKKIATR